MGWGGQANGIISDSLSSRSACSRSRRSSSNQPWPSQRHAAIRRILHLLLLCFINLLLPLFISVCLCSPSAPLSVLILLWSELDGEPCSFFFFFFFYESDEFLFHAPDPAVIFICFFHKDTCPAWETALTLWLKPVISRAFVVFVMFAEIQDTFIQCRSRCQFRVGLQSVLNGSLMENSWVNQKV